MIKRRVDRPAMATLLEMLEQGGDVTARTLAEKTGLSERNAKRYLDLAIELGHAHIGRWIRYGARGRYMPRLAKGKGANAPEP